MSISRLKARNKVGNPLLPDEKHHISKVAPFSYISEVK